eukprot:TRINITY_DN96462_c0_g1_i1.p1 TRINITY_DN96462_c0_g1~~TRINITY_DN96462_c0_g1_i1.p1  ORF type:complete len:495 (+),score=89.05 TRINITY_DN96462_c0_g1_i1:80-1564(+)
MVMLRRHRSASPSCRGAGPGAGVATDGARGEVWRAVALQAHLLGPSHPPRRPPAGGAGRSASAGRDATSLLPADRAKQPAAPSTGLGQYAELDYEEKLKRHEASLSLAQRMGLVAKPSQPLTAEQWEKVKHASDSRQDSDVPCSICLDDFRERPQVILSCSHVFHGECLRSFEKFSGKRECPLCRCPSYDATVHHAGFMVWRKKCASRIQRAWRGYKSRSDVYHQLLQPNVRTEAPSLHRRYCGKALQAVGGKLEKACEEREDALDRFLEELDGSVAMCSAQLREGLLGFEQLHGSTVAAGLGNAPAEVPEALRESRTPPVQVATSPQVEQPVNGGQSAAGPVVDAECWAKARRAALGRGDEVDCPICFQSCQLRGKGGSRVELLSCSHVFHRCCLISFESFHVFETHLCPVCRQKYERRPWNNPEAADRPPRLPEAASDEVSASSEGPAGVPAGPWRVTGRGRGRGRGGSRGVSSSSAKQSSSRPDYRVLRGT